MVSSGGGVGVVSGFGWGGVVKVCSVPWIVALMFVAVVR